MHNVFLNKSWRAQVQLRRKGKKIEICNIHVFKQIIKYFVKEWECSFHKLRISCNWKGIFLKRIDISFLLVFNGHVYAYDIDILLQNLGKGGMWKSLGEKVCQARCFSVGLSQILRSEPNWLAQKNHYKKNICTKQKSTLLNAYQSMLKQGQHP